MSRTVEVKLDWPANSGARSGLFCRLAVPTGQSTILRVPASAIVQRGQMEIVFVTVDKVPMIDVLVSMPASGRRKSRSGVTSAPFNLQRLPALQGGSGRLEMGWRGQITIEVFRDLGLAFAAVLVLIHPG